MMLYSSTNDDVFGASHAKTKSPEKLIHTDKGNLTQSVGINCSDSDLKRSVVGIDIMSNAAANASANENVK
jgi:hypothetical protein